MLKTAIAVLLGGALGALARWGLHVWIDAKTAQSNFPWGILAVNVLGCFLFGLLFALGESRQWFSEAVRMMLFTGFLGSFTTFSTFGWNTLSLLREGQTTLAFGNVLLSVSLGLFAVWVGFLLGELTLKTPQ